VLTTNTDLPTDEVALKYKQLWMVEDVFRSMKSLLDTGRFFTSATKRFAARILLVSGAAASQGTARSTARKEWKLEWADVVRDLDNLNEMKTAINNKSFVFRGQTSGVRARSFRPAASPCHPCCAHAEFASGSAQWRESVSLHRFQNRNLLKMDHFRWHGVEDQSKESR